MGYYFAWVGPDEVFDPDIHNRMDEDIFEYSLQHREGNFASLTIVMANPGVPLLAEGRERWAIFSEDGDSGIVQRFRGRVIAIPDVGVENELQVTLLARPPDYQDQKTALAETLKEDPQFWDPLLIDPSTRDDPDAVMTARTQSLFVDPVTLDLSVSDNVTGEAGLIVLAADEVYDENASISYGQPPARSIEVKAEFRWNQASTGSFDIGPLIAGAFGAIPGMVTSYTGDDLASQWPKLGANMGGGWTISGGALQDGAGKWVSSETTDANRITLFAKDVGQSGVASSESIAMDLEYKVMKPTLNVGHDVERSYTEIVTFTLRAGVQDVVSDGEGDDEVLRLTLATNDVAEPIDPGDLMPIRDIRRRSYMATDRGHDTMRYLIARARASLIDRARCVQASADIDYERRFDVSLKHSIQLPHPIIPGQVAQGKVIDIRESCSGDSGDAIVNVTIGCCPGTGGTISAAAGTGVYAQDGYMQNGYQQREGATVLVAGDVTFEEYNLIPNDDGVDLLTLSPTNIVRSISIQNGAAEQQAELVPQYSDFEGALDAIKNLATGICAEMLPITGGPFTTQIPVTVSDVVIPKQIDLAA